MNSPDHIPTILIVDDEEAIRYFLGRFLTREGYHVSAAASGESALAQLAAAEFDVILLDLKMKGLSGLEVLATLRQRWPATTVIVLTAHASLESAVEALRYGAHDYLFKPCKTSDLRESIRTGLLRRQERLQFKYGAPPTPAEPTTPLETVLIAAPDEQGRFIQHSGLIVDSIRHIITLDNAMLDLSPTEFNLLVYLIREAPRVVPAQELIREVQQYDTGAIEAAEIIRSHIYHIRQKASAVSPRAFIRTVRGIGYAIAA